MSGLIFSPQIVRKIEDNMRYILVSTWERRQKNLWWRRLMKVRPSSTKRELLQWMLETAKIRNLGNGGRIGFDDLMEISHEIENEDVGEGLRLTVNGIEDALNSPAVQGNVLDRAATWARHMGNWGSYWPQDQGAYLLKNGKTLLCYDGLPFFSATHLINPYGAAVAANQYKNLHTAKPFNTTNLAAIVAYIRGIKAPDGSPRHLEPKIVLAGVDLQYSVTQALGADVYADPNNSQGAPASNIVKTSYGFEPPIIAPELDEAGVWYLACELVEDDELSGLIFQERKPFGMNSYSPLADAQLGQMDEFEWHFKGRNVAAYGHPFLLHRVEPA
jgi:phage major head subunit gpT-like protein